jgi:hypothetical protein
MPEGVQGRCRLSLAGCGLVVVCLACRWISNVGGRQEHERETRTRTAGAEMRSGMAYEVGATGTGNKSCSRPLRYVNATETAPRTGRRYLYSSPTTTCASERQNAATRKVSVDLKRRSKALQSKARVPLAVAHHGPLPKGQCVGTYGLHSHERIYVLSAATLLCALRTVCMSTPEFSPVSGRG